MFEGGTIFCRMTIDDFLGSHYIAVSAVAEEDEPCFWIAWDDVTENESGYVFESCKGVLSVLDCAWDTVVSTNIWPPWII